MEEIETNKVICGDSLEVLKTFPDKSVHVVLCSPPYWVSNISYNQGSDVSSRDVLGEWNKYVIWLCSIFNECTRILIPSGKLIINIDDRHTSLKSGLKKNIILPTHAALIMNLREKLDYKFFILWKKIRSSRASGGSSRVLGSYGRFGSPGEIPVIEETEFILGFRKYGQRKDINDDRRKESALTNEEFKKWGRGVWDDIRPCMGKNKYDHPCPYPVELCERLIKLNSFKRDIILDPFGGVGSTAVAAKNLDRKYISIDLEQKYCDIAEQRLSEI